jgi:hypothetical protein
MKKMTNCQQTRVMMSNRDNLTAFLLPTMNATPTSRFRHSLLSKWTEEFRTHLVLIGNNQVVFGAADGIAPVENNTAGMEGRQCGTVPFVLSHSAKSRGTMAWVVLFSSMNLITCLTHAVLKQSKKLRNQHASTETGMCCNLVLVAVKMSVVMMVVVVMIRMMRLRTDHQWYHLLLRHHLLILEMLKVVSVVPFQTEAEVQLSIYHKELQDREFYNENSGVVS